MPSHDEIRAYWDEQAAKHGADCEATTPDRFLRELEVAAIIRNVPPWKPSGDFDMADLLDVGCGNGWSTVRIKEARPEYDVSGVDFSPGMVAEARKTPGIMWYERDVRELGFADGCYDVVTSARCLINLTSLEDQVKAAQEIRRVLRPGGIYVMAENSVEGLAELNDWRSMLQLPRIDVRWHNKYLDRAFFRLIEPFLRMEHREGFETYYKLSRVVNARLAADAKEEPRYDARVNEIGYALPRGGPWGPLQVRVFRAI